MEAIEGALPILAAADPTARYRVIAKNQPEYTPLPAIIYDDGKVCTEWRLTEDERQRIARGENLRLWVWTFGQPLQPVALEVTTEDA